MKTIWIPISLLVGVGCGWMLGSLRETDAERGAATGADLPAAERPTDGSIPPPTLRGAAAPEGTTPVVGTRPGPLVPAPGELEVIDFIDGEWEEWGEEWEWIPEPVLSADHRGWNALLTLYALAGRPDDFMRAVPRALACGLPPGTVLELVNLLPPDQRAAVLDQILAAHPEVEWDMETVADQYAGAGAAARALAILLPALEANPTTGLAIRLVNADAEQAARVLGAMAASGVFDGDALGRIGNALVGAGHPDLGLPFLLDALRTSPFDQGVLNTLYNADPQAGLAHARSLTEEYAERADVWTWYAGFLMQEGDGAAAFEAYREGASRQLTTDALYGMLRADPDRAYAAAAELTHTTNDDEVLGVVAKLAMSSGSPEDAMETLLRAHELDPGDHEWMVAMVALDPERAADALRRSRAGTTNDEIIGAYGNALRASGRSAQAFEEYLEAHTIDPGDWEWQRGLARADPVRAAPVLERRIADAGEEGDLLGALADAYAGMGRTQEALDYYDRAIAGGGGDEWYARMGRVDPERALGGLEERLRAEPNSSAVHVAMGDIYRDTGDMAAARQAYARALEHSPTTLAYQIRYQQAGGR